LLANGSIKKKLMLCVTLLALIVVTLSISGIVGVDAYRSVVRTITCRADELPLAHDLMTSVNVLVATYDRITQDEEQFDAVAYKPVAFKPVALQEHFNASLIDVSESLRLYRSQLEQIEPGTGLSENRQELDAVTKSEQILERIEAIRKEWVFERDDELLRTELTALEDQAAAFPNYLQQRMRALRRNVRGQYHTLIALTWTTSVLSVAMLLLVVKFSYDWVVRPFRIVLHGSRRVASGDFEHRVELSTKDEMAELAAGLNEMTTRFKAIRDDLDRQVRERTKQVVRSEQLASVGFLAAGVAHEINNPLAAIAMCAESLESRLHDIIAADDAKPDDEHNHEITILRKYLRRIQDESFRCKGITEKLLNYSRLGDAEKHDTNLNAIVHDVIDLLQTLVKYRSKRIEFHAGSPLMARVVPEEIKQVVLNLITNALDSLDADGLVHIELTRRGNQAELLVRDNGCGMTEEVQKHLFEPFFTRRRDGHGTGLGLSITYRILVDHGGTIDVHSDGPGRGSLFRIALPLNQHEERYEKSQAA
jgi:two-component system NtrC family sensor kinase